MRKSNESAHSKGAINSNKANRGTSHLYCFFVSFVYAIQLICIFLLYVGMGAVGPYADVIQEFQVLLTFIGILGVHYVLINLNLNGVRVVTCYRLGFAVVDAFFLFLLLNLLVGNNRFTLSGNVIGVIIIPIFMVMARAIDVIWAMKRCASMSFSPDDTTQLSQPSKKQTGLMTRVTPAMLLYIAGCSIVGVGILWVLEINIYYIDHTHNLSAFAIDAFHSNTIVLLCVVLMAIALIGVHYWLINPRQNGTIWHALYTFLLAGYEWCIFFLTDVFIWHLLEHIYSESTGSELIWTSILPVAALQVLLFVVRIIYIIRIIKKKNIKIRNAAKKFWSIVRAA